MNDTLKANTPRELRRLVYAGTFGPPFLTFARSCHARGIDVYLMEIGPQTRRFSRSVAGYNNLDTALLYRPEGIRAIRNYVTHVKAEALIALSEQHILWLSRERTAFDGLAKVLLPPYETLAFLRSKYAQANLARSVGLEVLPTYILKRSEDTDQVLSEHYPLCLRPSGEGAALPIFKAEVVNSPSELRRRLAGLQILDSVVGQPFQALPNLVIHGVSSENAEPLLLAAFLADRKFEGVSLRLRRAELPSKIGSQLSEFGRLARLTGAYHYDLLYDQVRSKAYFLEVNPRLGGTTDKVVWLGYDEPALCLNSYGYKVGPALRRFHNDRTYVVNKRTLLKHMLSCLRGELQPMDYPPVSSLRNWLDSTLDLLLARDSIFDLQDLIGTYFFHCRRSARNSAV